MTDKCLFDYQLYDNLVEVLDAILLDFSNKMYKEDVELIHLVHEAVAERIEMFSDSCEFHIDRLWENQPVLNDNQKKIFDKFYDEVCCNTSEDESTDMNVDK